jgi:hypothetical protein
MDPDGFNNVADILQQMYDHGDTGLMVCHGDTGHWLPAGAKQYRDEMKQFALVLAAVLGVPVNDYEDMEEE